MLLQRKINRAMKWSRNRRLREEGRDPEQEALEREVASHGKGKWKDDLPPMEEIIREEEANRPLEKKDAFSLIVSGLITLVPVVVVLLVILFLIVYIFFFVR